MNVWQLFFICSGCGLIIGYMICALILPLIYKPHFPKLDNNQYVIDVKFTGTGKTYWVIQTIDYFCSYIEPSD